MRPRRGQRQLDPRSRRESPGVQAVLQHRDVLTWEPLVEVLIAQELAGSDEAIDPCGQPAQVRVSISKWQCDQRPERTQPLQIGARSGTVHAVPAELRPTTHLMIGSHQLAVGAEIPVVVQGHHARPARGQRDHAGRHPLDVLKVDDIGPRLGQERLEGRLDG